MLTRRRIIDAALVIAGDSGFAALSTREISTALGVSPMAIYRHVPSMEQLRAEVADGALAEVEMPPADLDGRERLRRILAEVYRVCRRYQGLSITVAQGPSTSAVEEALRAALRDAGVADDGDARLRLLVSVLIGACELERRGAMGSGQPEFAELLDLALTSLPGDHGP